MAGKGNSIPKPDAARRRRNKVDSSTVTDDGELRGPDLPAGVDWPAQTVQWWHNWRTSEVAQTFTSTDWDFLLDTAVLHGGFWMGDHSVANEIRIRVSKMGATHEDRLRLHINVSTDAESSIPKPKQGNPTPGRRNLKVV